MQKNVLIGIGGTGARVIESVIHLCAMGLGPDESLQIIIVDPDQANGNLSATKELLSSYKACREKYYKDRDENNKDWSKKLPLFKTEIKTTGVESYISRVTNSGGETLGNRIDYTLTEGPEKKFMEILFSSKELTTPLTEGFRGHPSIGSVLMANIDLNDSTFSCIWEQIEAREANDIRVFIVGSVFGGTGAAGFPTLGSIIKNYKKAEIGDGISKVLLGGSLILPYFSISDPKDIDPLKDPIYVTNDDFPVATKAALHYYSSKDIGFDQIYLIGDNQNQNVGKFSTGSSGQKNDPHYVELVSAFSAFDFFRQSSEKSIPEKKYFIAKRQSEKIDFDQIPYTRIKDDFNRLKNDFLEKFSYFTTTASTYISYSKNHRDDKEMNGQWVKDNFLNNSKKTSPDNWDLTNTTNQDIQKLYNDYFERYISWITTMSKISEFALINRNKLVGDGGEIIDPFVKANLQTLTNIINVSLPNKKNMATTYFVTSLSGKDKAQDTKLTAANKLLDIFYEASLDFINESYNLKK